MKTLGSKLTKFFGGADEQQYLPSALDNSGTDYQHARFADLLPYAGWDDDHRLFILSAANTTAVEAVGFTLEMIPQTGAPKEMPEQIGNLFQHLPAGASMQFILTATPLIDDFVQEFLDCWKSPGPLDTKDAHEKALLYKGLRERQAENFIHGSTTPLIPNAPYLFRHFRVLMSVTVPMSDLRDEAMLNRISSIRETCISALKTHHQFMSEWGPEDLINWGQVILNPQNSMAKRQHNPMNYDEGRFIRDQIIQPDTVTRITENGLLYGLPQQGNEIMARTMCVRSYPRAFTLNGMNGIIGDYMSSAVGYTCPFMITLGVIVSDYERTRSATQMKAARATQKAESKMARFMPEMQDQKHDWDLAQRAFDAGTGTVKIYHELVLFAKPSEIQRAEQAAQAVWRKRQFEILPDTFMQCQAMLSSLPMTLIPSMQRDIRIAQRVTTKTVTNAVNMAPVLAEWQGTSTPLVSLWGRRGQAMGVDLFDNTTGNYNAAVVGKSGSGKGVFLNTLTMSYLANGGRVWIIDIGRSYEKLCRMVNGQYIEFKFDADIRLNPFSMVENIEEDIELLVPLIEQMAAPNEGLTDYARRQLMMHIQDVWNEAKSENRKPTIDDLAVSLINNCEKGGPNPLKYDAEWVAKVAQMTQEEKKLHCDPLIRQVGMQLYPYTKDGAYGKFFQGEANIDFDSDFIVLELEELAAKPDLQAVVMLLVIFKITQSMYISSRTEKLKKKVVIIDEAWSLLGNSKSGRFIEGGYRKARKYLGSFVTATQGIDDYFMSPTAQAALANSDFLFLLSQKPESILALKKSERLLFDDSTEDMLMSLKTEHGIYADIFIKAGQMGEGIGRLILDPFTQLLASTTPEEVHQIAALRRSGLSTFDAINALLERRINHRKISKAA